MPSCASITPTASCIHGCHSSGPFSLLAAQGFRLSPGPISLQDRCVLSLGLGTKGVMGSASQVHLLLCFLPWILP